MVTENRNKWILVGYCRGQESWKVILGICLPYKVFVTIPSLHFDPQLSYKLVLTDEKAISIQIYEICGQGMCTENLSLLISASAISAFGLKI